jgi:DNA-binding LytR/AlgR family response regulator
MRDERIGGMQPACCWRAVPVQSFSQKRRKTMPTALIADDEAYLIDYLQARLRILWPQLRIVATALNGLDALRLADELAPDIAFLDIRMPGLSGLDVAQRLAESAQPPHVVFITAYEQHAVAAFEQSAIDYLLKPPSDERLQKTIEKLKVALQARRAPEIHSLLGQLSAQLQPIATAPEQGSVGSGSSAASTAPLQWIRAAHAGETRLIAIDEVIYFQSNDKYTSVMTADGECLIRTPLRELHGQLDSAQFWQIHRSTVVAVKHIAATKRDFRGRLLVKLKGRKEELVVSRNFVELFKQM